MTLVRLLLLVLTGTLVGTVVAVAQPLTAYHTTLFDHVDPSPGDWIEYSSLTGYVAPDGREYALLGGVFATYVYDVTTAPIRLVAMLRGPDSQWREIKTYRHYAYVVTDVASPYNGLQILDLSKLPDTATVLREDTTWFHTAHTVTREGDFLYINGTDVSAGVNGGTLIFNLAADPLHPTLVGKYATRYVHDATVRNDTLYAAAIYDGQLDIVYLGKDRKSPALVAEIRYPGAGTHSADVTADGSHLLTTDEINSTPKTLKVWDIRNVNGITKVADYTPAPGEIIHNVHVKEHLAYVSWYTAGTRILDISDPRNPAQLGYYDTFDTALAMTLGNWEVYPDLPSGKILASDRQNGLFVFTFDGVKKGAVSGRVLDAVTGTPIASASIELPAIRLRVSSDASGAWSFAGAADTLRAIVTASGYLPLADSVMPTLSGAARDFLLRPVNTGVGSTDQVGEVMAVTVEAGEVHGEGSVTIRGIGPGGLVRVVLVDRAGCAVADLVDVESPGGVVRIPIRLDGIAAGVYFWRAVDGHGYMIDRGSLILR